MLTMAVFGVALFFQSVRDVFIGTYSIMCANVVAVCINKTLYDVAYCKLQISFNMQSMGISPFSIT